MFHVHAIKSDKNKIYIGHTKNLDKRLARHNKKLPLKNKSFTYRVGRDWKLFYKEEYATRTEAIMREKELKSYQGRRFLKNKLKQQ